ncbi:hypothetical protein BG015_010875 [Linnemannia schmuckeri]|uniref:Uncharacterized protein n=1 Tax=Linnemannia schmuckeri TaxID=64567 RepID=A0A9P5RTH5_9FUNG|nr:hypothetical protein BG015_010875 [Linnemannia schmuckeri]
MKSGIVLLGLMASVASALPSGSTFARVDSTSLECRYDCISSTLTWTAEGGYRNEI